MKISKDDYFLYLLNKADEVGALEDPFISEILGIMSNGEQDSELNQILAEELDIKIFSDKLLPNPFRKNCPSKNNKEVQGQIKLAMTETGAIWGVDPDDLVCGITLIIGATGTGKTNLVSLLIYQLMGGKLEEIYK